MIKRLIFKIKLLIAPANKLGQLFASYYGFKLGRNSRFTGTDIRFGSEPFLIEIGDNVTITSDVSFQTHDGGVGILRKDYPGINVFGRIKVGTNVFIGEGAMIMYNVIIGDNVVIGARSVVTKSIPSNSVAVGSPARVIKTLEEYKESALSKAVFIRSKGEDRVMEILKAMSEKNN